MIKQGDRVSVDGKEVVIESIWGQGRHTAFKLEDGSVILDLHLREDATVVTPPVAKSTTGWGTTAAKKAVDVDAEEDEDM